MIFRKVVDSPKIVNLSKLLILEYGFFFDEGIRVEFGDDWIPMFDVIVGKSAESFFMVINWVLTNLFSNT